MSHVLYLFFFTFIAWHRFHLGLALFFLLLPTYLIRFSLGPLPTTLLEMMLWIVVVVWIVRYREWIMEHVSWIIRRHKMLFCAIALFMLAATISVFTSTNIREALGEWKAFYVEPIILFFILSTVLNDQLPNNARQIFNFQFSIFKRDPVTSILVALILSGLITSLLAIYQHFTGWMVPDAFWENQNTYRVTAWYGFPNAVGLFLAPIIPLILYMIKQYWIKMKEVESKKYKVKSILSIVIFLLSTFSFLLATVFARSTGALVGLAAGLLFFLFFYNKKTRWLSIIITIVGLSSILGLSSLSSIRQELLFQDRSGQIRLGIWSETIDFLKDSPILGAGLASYQEKIRPYHKPVNGENIEIFHHPHNIFLTMWVNLGLLGLVGFVLILVAIFNFQFSIFKPRRGPFGTIPNLPIFNLLILSSLVITLVMGLVDSPYTKNDLSILFWLLPALLIIARRDEQSIPQ